MRIFSKMAKGLFTKICLIVLLVFFLVISVNFLQLSNSTQRFKPGIYNIRNKVKSFFEELSIRYSPKAAIYRKEIERFDTFHLKLSPQDWNFFVQQSQKGITKKFLPKAVKGSRKAKLIHGGKERKVKVSLHGTVYNHWWGVKKSFKFKIDKGEKGIYGLRKFSLVISEIRGDIVPLISKVIADEFKLLQPEVRLVRLLINDFDYGMYYFEERINDDFLKRANVKDSVVVKLSENAWLEQKGNRYGLIGAGHVSHFDQDISNLVPIKHKESAHIYGVVQELFDKIENSEYEGIVSILDLDSFARHEAYRSVFAAVHDVCGDNLRMYYSLADGKLRPIVRFESYSELLAKMLVLRGGSTAHALNFYDGFPVKLMVYLNRLDDYRILKYKYLYHLKSAYDLRLDKEIKDIIDKYENIFIYSYSNRTKKSTIKNILEIIAPRIRNNLAVISRSLEESALYINIIQDNDINLEIVPNSETPLKFYKFTLNFSNPEFQGSCDIFTKNNAGQELIGRAKIKNGILSLEKILGGEMFMAGMRKDLALIRREYNLVLKITTRENWPVPKKVEISVGNAITGRILDAEKVHIAIGEKRSPLVNRN